MADLNIEIQWNRIIVTMPGTSFTATYRREASGIDRIGLTGSDLNAPISRDFITRADEVANEHARQLGWIV
jgi:hypothetical protein